jgi:hypothetical protein
MQILKEFDLKDWLSPLSTSLQSIAINHLENGKILYFPNLPFLLFSDEQPVLSTSISNIKTKNISFNSLTHQLNGFNRRAFNPIILQNMMSRFAQFALSLINNTLPSYCHVLQIGRTSFRPIEIYGRKPKSYRKDDTRLHVDAFPASPNQGRRILRVFTNINPHGKNRVWRYGEPFATVVNRFLPQIKKPWPGRSTVLKALGITKSYCTDYDYIMLNIHDKMKADMRYQKTAVQGEIDFAPGNTWIVQTDHVSHAALSGQFLLEQTFYLPVSAMQNPSLSPLRILEMSQGRKLVDNNF